VSFVYSPSPSSWRSWFRQKRRHLSTGREYATDAAFRTTLFALSWVLIWVAAPWLVLRAPAIVLIALLLLWTLFAWQALRFREYGLIPWFPLLAILYCFVLITFAVLLIFPSPRTWNTS
jgi:hypothetical protein